MVNKKSGRIALFWDKSYLWGLIAYDTFQRLGVDFDLITAEDVRGGRLEHYAVVFVPGGWAGDKFEALGDEGSERLRRFVAAGGSYLGFCGGAGLALTHESGLSLAPASRKPTNARLPSFSGRVALKHEAAKHPMWSGIPDGMAFHAWWPGQFSIPDDVGIKILASYGEPEDGSYVADLQVGPGVEWERWEKEYGTNLDPGRIIGEPAVIEAAFGQGRVLLSYLHFETPRDDVGHRVLLNILEYLGGGKQGKIDKAASASTALRMTGTQRDGRDGDNRAPGNRVATLALQLEAAAQDLIDFGSDNFLWIQRHPWILQWQRGVRGMEYSTLYSMLKRLRELAEQTGDAGETAIGNMEELKRLALAFFGEARRLLLRERSAMNRGPVSPLETGDPEIGELRERLFSSSKRCGGLYRDVVERIDELLLPLLLRDSRK